MNHQKGFATLLTTVILVMLVSTSVFIGTKSSVLQQKTANNIYRTEIAFENADKGIRAMMNNLKAIISSNPQTTALTADPLVISGVYSTYYCTAVTVNCNSSLTLQFPYILSTGYDETGSPKKITQRVNFRRWNPGSSNPINGALDALGTATLTGNASAIGADGINGSIVAGSGGSYGNGRNTTTVGASPQYQIQSRSMTTDEFFMYHFSRFCPISSSTNSPSSCQAEAKLNIQNDPKGYICNSNCIGTTLLTQYQNNKRIFWITQNDITLNGNITLGSSSDPVLVIVVNNGNITFNGAFKIIGEVYVDVPSTLGNQNGVVLETLGEWNDIGGGNSRVTGAVVVGGNFSANGNITMSYDSSVINNIPSLNAAITNDSVGWSDMY